LVSSTSDNVQSHRYDGGVGRWEPNARDRLAGAALELFSERGYQAVTVAEITERAGLTKASYFRHFTDKCEALFAGQDILVDLVRRATADASEDLSPRELVGAALDAMAVVFTPDRHTQAGTRQAVIDGVPELRERLTAKCAAIGQALATALQARGVPTTTAQVAGQLGQLAFTTASQQWIASPDGCNFATLARNALDDAVTAAAALGGETERLPHLALNGRG
jgi:AcrR family transcriptional regulator